MEPILFAGYPAGSSLGLVAASEWLGLPYRVARVDMLTEMHTAEYTRVNGRQETPVLIHEDGRVLTETMAIARWLEDRDRDHKISYPAGSPESYRMLQLMGFINSSFTSAFTPLWVVFEKADLSDQDREALRTLGRELVLKRHQQLEAMMGSTPYLVGDRPSLADALFVGVARWADFHKIAGLEKFPKIAALKERLKSDVGVQFGHAVEDGTSLPDSTAMLGLVPLQEALNQKLPTAA